MLYFYRELVLGMVFSSARGSKSLAFGLVGEWLSLVEHLVRDQGVGGSNPLSPTNPFQSLRILACLETEPLVRLLWVPDATVVFNDG